MAKNDWRTFEVFYRNVVSGMCGTLDGVLSSLCKTGLQQFENMAANELCAAEPYEICHNALFCDEQNNTL